MPQAAIAALAKVFIYYGVKAAIAKFAATIFVYAASSYLLNRAAKSMTPKARSSGALFGTDVNYYNSGASIRIGYGRIRTGGMETIPPLVGGTNNKLLHKVLTLVGHEVDSFNETYFDNVIISNTMIGSMSYTSSDGQIKSGVYSGHAYIRYYRGTTTDSADRLLNDYDAGVFQNFRGRSFAKGAVTLVYNQDVYKNVPDVSFLYQAKRCYDPRLDVAPGGSPTNVAYHRWGTAGSGVPALALADYLMSDFGGSYSASDIDWDTVVTAANNCDALVPRSVQYTAFAVSAGMTQTGFTFTKTSGVDGWDSSFRSTDSFTGGSKVTVTFKAESFNNVMVAFNGDPTTDNNFTSLDRALFLVNTGQVQVYENGSLEGTFATSWSVNDIFMLVYYNGYVEYYMNGVMLKRTQTSGTKFLDSSFYHVGASITLGVGKRYTCNGILQATDKFEDNVKALANSMLGRIIFRDGKWRMYAGGWKTPSFTIQKNDWISSVSVKFEQGKAKRFNRMHAWFIDPDRAWQREECYPRSNPTYVTADKGEVIDGEFEDLLCTNEEEAQCKSEFLLRQSRNQIVITGRLPPKFQDVALWDTGTIVMDQFGWGSKTFRAVSLDLNPDGTVDGVFQEEQSTDWDDLDQDDYNIPSDTPLPVTNVTTPSEPLNFSAVRQINGTILFSWGVPIVFPAGSSYEIIRSTNTLATGGVNTTIWQGFASPVPLVCPTSRHWYFARARTPQNVLSNYTPNTFGLGVSARLEADQTLQQRIVSDAEFDYSEAASLWKNDILYLASTSGGNLWADPSAPSVNTAVYFGTGGQFGGYVNLRRSHTNTVQFGAIYRSYNEQLPNGYPYSGRPFGFEIAARFRINSEAPSGNGEQFQFVLISQFTTPNTTTLVRMVKNITVTSAHYSTLGGWSEYRTQGRVVYPTDGSGVSITSGFSHGLIPGIWLTTTANVDIDYFQVTNLTHVNYPLEVLLQGGPSALFEEDSMASTVFVNCFADGSLSFNVFNPRLDWRRWQIGRVFEITKPQMVRPVYLIPGSVNPPNLILAGRASVGTITMATSQYSYATIEKVSDNDLFVSGGGLS